MLGYLTLVKPIENLASATGENLGSLYNATITTASAAADVTLEGVKQAHDASVTLQQGVKLGENLVLTGDTLVGGTLGAVNYIFDGTKAAAWLVSEGAKKLYTSSGQLYDYVTTDTMSSNLRHAIPGVGSTIESVGMAGIAEDNTLIDLATGESLWLDQAHSIPATANDYLDATVFEWNTPTDSLGYSGLTIPTEEIGSSWQARDFNDLVNGKSFSDCCNWTTAQFDVLWNNWCPQSSILEQARPYVETPEFICGMAGCCIFTSIYICQERLWAKRVSAAIATEGESEAASQSLTDTMTKTTQLLATSTGQTALGVGMGAAALCFPGATATLATLKAITNPLTNKPKGSNIQRTLGLQDDKKEPQKMLDESRQPNNIPETLMTQYEDPRTSQLRRRNVGLLQNEQPSSSELVVKGPPQPGWILRNGVWQPPPPPKRGGTRKGNKLLNKRNRRTTHKKGNMKKRVSTRKIRRVRKARRTRRYSRK